MIHGEDTWRSRPPQKQTKNDGLRPSQHEGPNATSNCLHTVRNEIMARQNDPRRWPTIRIKTASQLHIPHNTKIEAERRPKIATKWSKEPQLQTRPDTLIEPRFE